MTIGRTLSLLAAWLLTTSALAQQPVRLRWQQDQVLTYRVEQKTEITETAAGQSITSRTHMSLTKRWQVAAVDAGGVATLHLSLTALRLETKPPSGPAIVFDSAKLDESDAQMKEQLGRYLNATLAVLRMDGQGRIVEVKESKFGPKSRFENELPFAVELPNDPAAVGLTWQRNYRLQLDPPEGTGEKHEALHKCTCTRADTTAVVVKLVTELKSPPKTQAELAPLMRLLPEGEVVFDVRNGRMYSAALKVEKEVKGHHGEGSSYKVTSSYAEQFMP